MKRGGPLRRKQPLRAKAPLAQRSQLAKRSTRRWPVDTVLAAHWHKVVTAGGCVVCRYHGQRQTTVTQGHHVLEQKHIRGYVRGLRHLAAVDRALLLQRLLWDARGGVGVCCDHHRRHHNRTEPIPAACVPQGAYVYAAELGLTRILERMYAT